MRLGATASVLIAPFSEQPTRALATAMNSLRTVCDDVERIWVFDSEQRPDGQPFPAEIQFRSSSGLWFVAPFSSGRLMVFESATQKYRSAKGRAFIALDSNMCSLLRKVFISDSQDAGDIKTIIDLAKHNRIWRSEIQPAPYLREVVMRTRVVDMRDDAEKAVLSVFKLQALLPESSEGAGRLLYDDNFFERIEAQFGVRTFEEAASKQVQQMIDKGDAGLDYDHIGIYAALLKMIDVSIRWKQRTLEEKLAEVDGFIVVEMESVQPRLFVLARLFFQGTLAKLLKIGAGDANFARKHLIGSSYDLYLTTIHEKFLGMSDEPPEGWLSILCTLDQGLAEYAGRFPLLSLAVMKDHSFRIAHDWDDQWLKAALGDEHHAEVIRSVTARIPSAKTTWLSKQMIEAIRDLEARLDVEPKHSLLGEITQEQIIGQNTPPPTAAN